MYNKLRKLKRAKKEDMACLWPCRGSSLQRCVKTASVINGKIKKFPSLLSPESLDDTAFDAVSSKLADHDGRVSQF